MENTSNSSSPTNGIVGNQIFTDKPDELVSTGNIQPQLQSLLQLHPNLLPTFHLSQQQKKCLHRRILLQSQTLPSQSTAAFTPSAQHAFPVQPPPMQQQQQQQRIPPSRMTPSPTSLNAIGNHPSSVINATAAAAASAIISAAGSQTVNMINAANNGNAANNTTNNANQGNPSTNNVPIIHNQNGLVQQLNAALLAERYLLMDLVEGSTLYKCIDVKTHDELVCKVNIFTI